MEMLTMSISGDANIRQEPVHVSNELIFSIRANPI
jgi:hypothetical protein